MAVPRDAELSKLALRLGRRLRRAGLKLATAESCTGGLLAKCLTDLAGSSDYFERGWVTYSNDSKRTELGVDARVLRRQGAVSEAAAIAMAEGAIRNSRARVSIAITGIAGPGGATPGKPVGTVWVAWGIQRDQRMIAFALSFKFRGGRDAVRRQAVAVALAGLPNA